MGVALAVESRSASTSSPDILSVFEDSVRSASWGPDGVFHFGLVRAVTGV